MAQAPAGETSVAQYLNAELVIPINACLRYKALQHEMPAIQLAAWLPQSHHTPTLSADARQVWHRGWTVHAALPTHVVPLCCAGLDQPCFELQAASSEQARNAAQDQARITTVLDLALRVVEVDDNTPKPGVEEKALGELKRE